MASIGDISKYKGLAANRAPFFDGSDYVYQKTRMLIFLKCKAEEIWDAVETCPYIPMKTVDRKKVLTPKAKWTIHNK